MTTRIHGFFCFVIFSCAAFLMSTGKLVVQAEKAKKNTQTRTYEFRVILYSYIPPSRWIDKIDKKNGKVTIDRKTGKPEQVRDFSEMVKRIKSEFKAIDSSVKLTIAFPSWGFYYPSELKKWFEPSPSAGGYHLVEVDNVMLQQIVNKNWVQPWNLSKNEKSEFHLAGIASSTIANKVYGIPHWLCGHFVFTRHKRVSEAQNVDDFIKELRGIKNNIVNLVGTFNGSWNLPSLYLDSLVDSFGSIKPRNSTFGMPFIAALSDVKKLMRECEVNKKNPCFDTKESYKDNNIAAALFAQGKADAFFGYSERLNVILAQKKLPSGRIYIKSAPFGRRSTPLLFTDSFVKRADCDKKCQSIASKFVKYMNSKETLEWMLMNDDAEKGSVPRYLIPSTHSALTYKRVANDLYYKVIRREIANGVAFPNNFSIIKPSINKNLKKLLLSQ